MKILTLTSAAKICLAGCSTCAIGLAQASVGSSDQWRFKVFLDEKAIGIHSVDLVRGVDEVRVRTSADFNVKVLFVNAYSYLHDAEEVWRGGCLAGIRSSTNTNGKRQFVRGDGSLGSMSLETSDGPRELTGCVRSFAYWDIERLKSQRLLNPQTGSYEEVQLLELGPTKKYADGIPKDSLQYRIVTDEATIDLWYTRDMRWLALESTTKSGARLRYRLDEVTPG